MWSSEHASNYMNYFGYLDFEIKTEYRSEEKLTQIVNQFNIALMREILIQRVS